VPTVHGHPLRGARDCAIPHTGIKRSRRRVGASAAWIWNLGPTMRTWPA
jgi:hypothetical protein